MVSAGGTAHERLDTAVLRKLEALLAKEADLRGSALPHSQHEAEATARAFQRLLLRHHLSMSDVEYALSGQRNPVDAELFDPQEHGLRNLQRRTYWQEELASIVAEAHLCALLVVPGSNIVFFVGRRQDRAVCARAYAMLLRFAEVQSKRDTARVQYREGSTGGQYRMAWLRGFNLRIGQRYREYERQMVEQAVGQNEALARLPGGTGITSTSLVRRLDSARAEVAEWVAANVGLPEADLVSPPVDDFGGLSAGYRAGGDPPLHEHERLEG